MSKEKIRTIINDTVYTNGAYPHKGNNSILASNLILCDLGITDIDIICELAKIIDKNITYDHEISDTDLDNIISMCDIVIHKHINVTTVEYHKLLHKESAEKFFTGNMKDVFPVEFVNNMIDFIEHKKMTDATLTHKWADEEELAIGEYSMEVKFSLHKKCNRKLSLIQKIKNFLKSS